MTANPRFKHNNYTNAAFLLTAVALQALLFWLSYIIYQAWTAAFGPGWRTLEWTFCLFSFTFITATLLAVRFRSPVVRWYYWFAAYWFAFIGPLFGSAALFVILEQLGPYIGLELPLFSAGVISFGAGLVFIIYGIWQSQRAQTTRISLALLNLPDQWKGKKVLLVADLHLGAVRGARFAKKVVRKIQALAPEIVLIAGDLYDGVKCDAAELIAPLQALNVPRGVYLASGNHDYYSDHDLFFAAIKNACITVLNNRIVDLDGLQFAGVDFQDTDYRENLAAVLHDMPLDRAKPSIMVRHEPTQLDLIEQKGFSASFSGHTHRGQFWPLSLMTNYLFKGYDYGVKKLGAMTVVTTSGVGTWGPPFRLGTRSEIVEITLVAEN